MASNKIPSLDYVPSDEALNQAVALFYDGKSAPTVSATGRGATAEEIIQLAQENNVPICDNPPLVSLLGQLQLGDEIPEALYLVVAHIIAFAYSMTLEPGETPLVSDQ